MEEIVHQGTWGGVRHGSSQQGDVYFFRTKRKDGAGDPPAQMSRETTADVVEVGDPPSLQMVARMLLKEL